MVESRTSFPHDWSGVLSPLRARRRAPIGWFGGASWHGAILLLLAGCSPSPPTTESSTPAAGPQPEVSKSETAPQDLSPEKWMLRAKRYLGQSHLSRCEDELRAILKLDPDHIEACQFLLLLLNSEGRRWEANDLSFRLVELGVFTIQDLIMLATPQEAYEDAALIGDALQRVPDDPLPGIGLLRSYRRENRNQEALELLRKIVAKYPGQPEAQAQLGLLLVDLDQQSEFLQWQAACPEQVKAHPDYWLALGSWSQRQGQLSAAVRCYWEAVHRAPDHRWANHNLGAVLAKLGETEASAMFGARAKKLAEVEQLVFPMFKNGPTVAEVRRVAQLMEELGRVWEAWGWQVALQNLSGEDPSAEARQRLRALLDRDHPPPVLAAANPALVFDLSRFSLPRFPAVGSAGTGTAEESAGSVDFPDVAVEAGIDFRYFDSWVAAQRELMLLETIGGGVAILDYDNDGWPDLYLTQCCKWPVDLSDDSLVDRLYRNLGNGTFRDVTRECGIWENGYGQGATVADIDNDGFPDLYVANVGQNRLYHNNGDGTFSLLPHHEDSRLIWTISPVIADFNGDALPDIYDVNYCAGEDVYTRHCIIGGYLRSCGPARFPGEFDALFLNNGDGTWRDVSLAAGVREFCGRGIGVLAADFNRSGQLQIYVSNDVFANFLLVNDSVTPGADPHFTDQGTLTGLAFDREGRTQASMGIACDDVNGDGLLDILLGNYYNDCNTLYIQQPGGLFVDETREYGLRDPSFLLLTFGSQLLDGDLDGHPDLVIANGHVDDFRFQGIPWHMRPQYFRNVEGKRFVELQGTRAGNYFDKEYLGRGLALVDWNRDGREEFAVSNIADKASLTINRTRDTGHWLAVRLHGVQSARGAVGTEVSVDFAGRTRTRQLVAGSGFAASNQQQLIFGLGGAGSVDEIRVSWPSGLQQKFPDILVDREYVLIEGDSQAHALPRDP